MKTYTQVQFSDQFVRGKNRNRQQRLKSRLTKSGGERAFGLNKVAISIIDDDELVRDAVRDLVRSLGYDAKAFASAEDYLQSDSVWASSCLITDLHMPGMSGAELRDHLIAQGNPTPIIFMTAFFDEKTRSQVLKAGGCGFFRKPLDENAFVQCLEKALKTAA